MTSRVEDTAFRRLCLAYVDKNKISQAEFSRRLGINKATVHKYLAGTRPITKEKKDIIRRYFEDNDVLKRGKL